MFTATLQLLIAAFLVFTVFLLLSLLFYIFAGFLHRLLLFYKFSALFYLSVLFYTVYCFATPSGLFDTFTVFLNLSLLLTPFTAFLHIFYYSTSWLSQYIFTAFLSFSTPISDFPHLYVYFMPVTAYFLYLSLFCVLFYTVLYSYTHFTDFLHPH